MLRKIPMKKGTSTYKKLEPRHCEMLISCGKQGKTVFNFCDEIGITFDTFSEWKKNEDFSNACKLHDVALRSFTDNMVRDVAKGLVHANVNGIKLWSQKHGGYSETIDITQRSDDLDFVDTTIL